MQITVEAKEMTYLYNVLKPKTTFNGIEKYVESDCKKEILFYEVFEKQIRYFNKITNDPWIPEEIKTYVDFLDIPVVAPVDNFDDSNFVILKINNRRSKKLVQPIPKYTFEQFVEKLHTLFVLIEKWIQKNSTVPLEFKRNSPNKLK